MIPMGPAGAMHAAPDGAEPDGRWPEFWAVVLAGGQGTRLSAFVRQVLATERPKQFCRIVGSRSMLRHTWDRAAQVVGPDRIVRTLRRFHRRPGWLPAYARAQVQGAAAGS